MEVQFRVPEDPGENVKLLVMKIEDLSVDKIEPKFPNQQFYISMNI